MGGLRFSSTRKHSLRFANERVSSGKGIELSGLCDSLAQDFCQETLHGRTSLCRYSRFRASLLQVMWFSERSFLIITANTGYVLIQYRCFKSTILDSKRQEAINILIGAPLILISGEATELRAGISVWCHRVWWSPVPERGNMNDLGVLLSF